MYIWATVYKGSKISIKVIIIVNHTSGTTVFIKMHYGYKNHKAIRIKQSNVKNGMSGNMHTNGSRCFMLASKPYYHCMLLLLCPFQKLTKNGKSGEQSLEGKGVLIKFICIVK